MEYQLSETNMIQKGKLEEKIAQYEEQSKELYEEIRNIRKSKGMSAIEKSMAILEKQIEIEEIEVETTSQKEAIQGLYEKEMTNKQQSQARNKEISMEKCRHNMSKIKECTSMISMYKDIDYYEAQNAIIQMKIELEFKKRNAGVISKEEASRNIADLREELASNEEQISDLEVDLVEQQKQEEKKELHRQKSRGEISAEELQQKVSELKNKSVQVPTYEELTTNFEQLCIEYLEKNEQEQVHEREVSSGDKDVKNFSESAWMEEVQNQDIDKIHDQPMRRRTAEYCRVTDVFKMPDSVETYKDIEEYMGNKLGENYARGLEGEKAELARQFGIWQGKEAAEELETGTNATKAILELKKVDGLNIPEIEEIIGLDTSELHQDVYVATYETKCWDDKRQREVMKPLKEYYIKDENGEMVIIGLEEDSKATFLLDDMEFKIDSEEIEQGKCLEKVTNREMDDRLMKNAIEHSMKSGKVTQVAEITDSTFLNDFAKQCNLPENYGVPRDVYIISTINEKGEEDFDIVMRYLGNDLNSVYEHYEGIEASEKNGKDMFVKDGTKLAGGMELAAKRESLKEFETKSGHRYSISRDKNGKLEFNEIFRENENRMEAKAVDTYTYSTADLLQTYQSAEINQEDINKAYKTMENTKEEKEQTNAKKNEFEGR